MVVSPTDMWPAIALINDLRWQLAVGHYAGLTMDGFRLVRKVLEPILARLVTGEVDRWR